MFKASIRILPINREASPLQKTFKKRNRKIAKRETKLLATQHSETLPKSPALFHNFKFLTFNFIKHPALFCKPKSTLSKLLTLYTYTPLLPLFKICPEHHQNQKLKLSLTNFSKQSGKRLLTLITLLSIISCAYSSNIM